MEHSATAAIVFGLAAVTAVSAGLFRSRSMEPSIASTPNAIEFDQLGWSVMLREEILRVDYAVGRRAGHLVVRTPDKVSGLRAFAEALVEERDVEVTFINRSLVGLEGGQPGMLHVGQSMRAQPIAPLVLPVSGLPDSVRALVEAVDRAAIGEACEDLARVKGIRP